MARRVISSLGTAASIIGLAFVPQLPIYIVLLIVLIGLTCLSFLIYDDIKASQKNERICHSEEEIRSAMRDLIKTPGQIKMMSRNLSWAENPEMEACIKSRGSDITIYAETPIRLTKRLEEAGVNVRYYGHLNFEPKTRFTVVAFNRQNPQVAIANTELSVKKPLVKHTIYETTGDSDHDQWLTSLALDMVEICELASSNEGPDGSN